MHDPNSPKLRSWLEIAPDSDFPIQNLPFGTFRRGGHAAAVGVAIGDRVLDLAAVSELGALEGLGLPRDVFRSDVLNPLLLAGKDAVRALRTRVSSLLLDENDTLKAYADKVLHDQDSVDLLMPVRVGDYTDFYASEQHATNVGSMFRDPENALLPNWKHLPVGYHGRASSIVVSGTPVHRPMGQLRPDDNAPPVFGASRLLDFELEMGCFSFAGKPLGQRISTAEADEYLFGLVLFNDWSARDVQKWEYQPLGPFLAKSFASSISPWVVTLDALEPFRIPGPQQKPAVLEYLSQDQPSHYDIRLEALIAPAGGELTPVCASNMKNLYWSLRQMLAHHTVNGCNMRAGDCFATGTISGESADSYGSMLELTWRGSKPITLSDGSERKFLADGDTVVFRGYAEKDGVRIGFGEVRSEVLAPVPLAES